LARFFPIIGMAILQTIAVGFAMLLLLVPGIILLVRWGAALPACVVEERGPIESLSRSWHLTKGYGWSIFGIMAILMIVNVVVSLIIDVAFAGLGIQVTAILNFLWAALVAAYWNCVLIMTYHDLRVVKEGVDIDQIAAVFD
jgi:hypothetical protein